MSICLSDSIPKHYENILEKDKIVTLEEVYMLTDVSLEF